MKKLEQLYSVSVKNFDDKIEGILLKESDEWILIKSLYADYIVDGFKIVKKKDIINISRSTREIFKENVLKVNTKWDIRFPIDIPIENTHDLCEYFRKKQILIAFNCDTDNLFYVGYVEKVLKKSFHLKSLNPNGEWNGKLSTIWLVDISVFSMDSNYLSSLCAYTSNLGEK